MTESKVPVLFVIFNRRDVSVEAFKAIREYRPDRLYIAADGPRKTKPGEDKKCEVTRQAVLDMIDWPCRIETLFRTENLGCAAGVSGAISWFFEHEEFGVILEDDIIVSQDFFRLCKELGEKYRDDERVMEITAMYLGKKEYAKASYGFSNTMQCWGWASWRRAWKHMDMSMSRFPQNGVTKHIRAFGLFKGLMLYYYYWRHDYRLISSGGDISSWATRWAFNIFASDGLVIVPGVNLMRNIGFEGADGTHYSEDDSDLYSRLRISNLTWPLKHPEGIAADGWLSRIERRDFTRIRIYGFKNIVKRKFRELMHSN